MPVADRRVVLMTHHALLREWSLGELRIPNRIVMAPMSTNRADKLGRVTTGLTRYLKRRAAGGCGLIVIESATVDSAFGSSGRTLRIDGDEQISGLRELVDELHETGAVVAAQLWHAGPRAEVKDGLPISPSGATAGMPVSRGLEVSEIEGIARRFIEAADRAVQAGFDAVEIHAAHGYLLHHFIDRITNRRTDEYGGSIQRRYRILADIRAGIRARSQRLPVILRLSLRPDDDSAAIGGAIQDAGFDGVDVRTGFSSMPSAEGVAVEAGYTLELARKLRKHTSQPLMTGGRILTPQDAEEAILKYGLDAVVLGRPLLADPDWVRKAAAGEEITLCVYDCEPSCYGRFKEGDDLHCVFHERRE